MKVFLIIIVAVFIIVSIWSVRIMISNYRFKWALKKSLKILKLASEDEEADQRTREEAKRLIPLIKKMIKEVKITKPIEWEDEP